MRRFSPALLVLALSGALCAATLPQPALASPPAVVPPGPVGDPSALVSVTTGQTAPVAGDLTAVLTLAQSAQQLAALHTLASTAQESRLSPRALVGAATNRTAVLKALRPAAGQSTAVAAFAAAHGLRVQHTTSASVLLAGPAAVMAQVFRTTLAADALHRRYAVSAPLVPVALTGAVSSVIGLDERPAMVPHAVPHGFDGPALKAAYNVVAPASTGAGLTVATVQFSGWHPSDATTYATAAGITLTPGQITTISVDKASLAPTPGSYDDVEVALDTQAILATAPAANQRVYVAPNSSAGGVDMINQMADDAAAGLVQVASNSWGRCENFTPASYEIAFGRGIDRLVAAGATFFSASGDSGSFDCAQPGRPIPVLNVDFPASYPNTVAVGGTTLAITTRGISETAWGTVDPKATGKTFTGQGSGGGISQDFAQPGYQAGLGLGTAGRLVPDVSAVGDGRTGLGIYSKTHGGWVMAGGTSLSAPLWAGFTAGALSSVGRTTGLGNILPTLYANPSAFRDITAGNNGAYAARPGFDLVTGLGSPDWSKLTALLTGGSTPTPTPTATVSPVPTALPTPTASATPTVPPVPTPAPTPTVPPVPTPNVPVSISGGALQKPLTGSAFQVTGTGPANAPITVHFHRTGTPAWDYTLLRTVTSNASGAWSLPLATTADYAYYATAGLAADSPASQVVQLLPAPTVNGASPRVVRRNSTVTLSGLGVPGTVVYLHFAPLGTGGAPGAYSLVRTVAVAANGTWARSYLA